LTLIDALIGTANREKWECYCRLATELECTYVVGSAPGSQEPQIQKRCHTIFTSSSLEFSVSKAGRRRLAQRGLSLPFAGMPSPFGGSGAAAFDAFLARYRGSERLLSEIRELEEELIHDFEAAGRSRTYLGSGFYHGDDKEVKPPWFGRVWLDFGRNVVVLPDRSEISGISITILPRSADKDSLVASHPITSECGDALSSESRQAAAPDANRGRRGRESQTVLRRALITLWERGAFGAGTGNEKVLALALRELGLSPADPPYGFKTAETVRKLRKELRM
jgi:hypothetical protein